MPINLPMTRRARRKDLFSLFPSFALRSASSGGKPGILFAIEPSSNRNGQAVISKRNLLKGLGAFVAGGVGLGTYAFGIEPRRLSITRYRVTPPSWPQGLKLKLAVIADLHACEPWMPMSRIDEIVASANALEPDAMLLLGDYTSEHRWVQAPVPDEEWAGALGKLRAPLGVHAVLGNHDWWNDRQTQLSFAGPPKCRAGLESAGVQVYENDVMRLQKDGQPFWLAGLGDQWAFYRNRDRQRGYRFGYRGVDDLPGMLAKVTDDAPVIMMAHEPDVFPRVSSRVSLTLSGHTHGGQVQLFGYAPIVPSRYGSRFLYGHIVEEERHLIVSGGLGCSGIPVRFGRPPEVLLVEVGV